MNDVDKIQSPHYLLVIDKKRNEIMALMYSVIVQNPMAKIQFNATLAPLKITHEDVQDFVNDWTTKEHELGWCEDPDCAYKPKQK